LALRKCREKSAKNRRNCPTPEWLSPVDRDYLAHWFNVDTFELGDRDKAKPD
jgi:hypothetical protein